jgi:hypothetical protein
MSVIHTLTATGNVYVALYSTLTSGVFYFDNIYLFNITALQTLQLYSPMYADTFDNLSDANIQAQFDDWIENGTDFTDDVTFLNSFDTIIQTSKVADELSLTNSQVGYYWQLYQDSIYFVDRFEFYTFENDATVSEFDEYLQEYEDLLDITPILYSTFDDNGGDYEIYETGIDDVDNIINNFLADLGLGTFGKFLILIVIIVAISIMLAVFNIPAVMILLVDLMIFLLSFLLGWVPSWVGILVVIILFAYLVFKLVGNKGGAD